MKYLLLLVSCLPLIAVAQTDYDRKQNRRIDRAEVINVKQDQKLRDLWERRSPGLYLAEGVDSIKWTPPYLCSWTDNYATCYDLAVRDTVVYAYPLVVVHKEQSGAKWDSIKLVGMDGGSVTFSGATFMVEGTMKLDIPGKGKGKILTSDSVGNATWQVDSSALTPAAPAIFTIVSDPLRLAAPADNTLYYYGTMSGTMSITVNNQRFPIGMNCTLIGVTFATRASAAATAENSTIYLRKNNQFDLALHAGIQFTGGQAGNMYTVAGLNQNYNAGDYIEFKLKCPTWVTNPTNIGIHTVLYFKTR